MAEAKTTTKKVTKTVTKRLPRLKGHNARQEEFFSVNFKNYIIQRGKPVEVPECIAKLIEDNEKTEEQALNYIDDLLEAEEYKKQHPFE
jgi:hypothetical protein